MEISICWAEKERNVWKQIEGMVNELCVNIIIFFKKPLSQANTIWRMIGISYKYRYYVMGAIAPESF